MAQGSTGTNASLLFIEPASTAAAKLDKTKKYRYGLDDGLRIKSKPKFKFSLNRSIHHDNIFLCRKVEGEKFHILFSIPILRCCFKSPANAIVTVE